MKIRFIISILLLPALINGQVTFNSEIGSRSEKAKVAIKPFYGHFISLSYSDIEVKTPPEWADKLEYEWAVMHKALPLELWLHIDPGVFALTNARVNALAENLTADLVTDVEPFSEELMERVKCTSGHWARVSGIDPEISDKSAAIIMSSYKADCGLMEFFLVFDEDRFEDVKEELSLMMLAFCFRPDPKDDESAGAGVKISFDQNSLRYCFQEVGKNAGAYNAGFLPGDLILSIDGNKEVYLEDIYSITSMLRGAEGSEVNVAVARDGLTLANNIVRAKLVPEKIEFLIPSSREVIREKIKVFTGYIFNLEDLLSLKGDEAGEDILGNPRWKCGLNFPGGFEGYFIHNTFLLDNYKISYRLASDENKDDTEAIYEIYKSIFEEAFGEEYDISETVDDNIVTLLVTDPLLDVLGNYFELIFDNSSYGRSLIVEYTFPQ